MSLSIWNKCIGGWPSGRVQACRNDLHVNGPVLPLRIGEKTHQPLVARYLWMYAMSLWRHDNREQPSFPIVVGCACPDPCPRNCMWRYLHHTYIQPRPAVCDTLIITVPLINFAYLLGTIPPRRPTVDSSIPKGPHPQARHWRRPLELESFAKSKPESTP